MKHVQHIFKAGETISAVIKLYNRHNMALDELENLMIEYNDLNNREVPKPGTSHKIPIGDNNGRNSR